MRKIGLVGCGAIGSELAAAIDSGKVANAKLVALFDIRQESAKKLARQLRRKPAVARTARELAARDVDLVVEAASQEAVRRYARIFLDSNHDLMIMSVGALLDTALYGNLRRAARKRCRRIYIPSGAIAGIDAIRSVRHVIEEVTLTTTKSPRGLEGAPFFRKRRIDPRRIKKAQVIYRGSAKEAVKLFPANVNVAAVLSLAGIGGEKTRVRIVADPRMKKNVHEITARGSFGEMHFRVMNIPSPKNPKTSYLAVLSAIECLRSICDDRIGIGT